MVNMKQPSSTVYWVIRNKWRHEGADSYFLYDNNVTMVGYQLKPSAKEATKFDTKDEAMRAREARISPKAWTIVKVTVVKKNVKLDVAAWLKDNEHMLNELERILEVVQEHERRIFFAGARPR